VLAPWESYFLYPGTVTQVIGNEAHIRYDDGDQGWVQLEQLHPLEIRQGLTVQARRPDRLYEPGEVVSVSGSSVEVRLDTGPTRWVAVSALRIPYFSSGPNARPGTSETRAPAPSREPPAARSPERSSADTPPGKSSGTNFGLGFLLGALVALAVLAIVIFGQK
jgi:hypothetical protein